jgi:hypothetical protein
MNVIGNLLPLTPACNITVNCLLQTVSLVTTIEANKCEEIVRLAPIFDQAI